MKKRVLMLVHKDWESRETIPPSDQERRTLWRAEHDVLQGLTSLGHEVLPLPVGDEVLPIRQAVESFKPHVAFNLLEEFHNEAIFDQHVVSYLELLKVRYTGCNPRGMMLARDKALSKKILAYHRIPVPKFATFPLGRRIKRPTKLSLPLIVKSQFEEASLGIAQASVVDTDDKLVERVQFIHEKVGTDAIAEQYVAGRELYVGVFGTRRLVVFPAVELHFGQLPPDAQIATAKVKWDPKYRKKHRIMSRRARLDDAAGKTLERLSKRIYRRLGLTGYARLDFRVDEKGTAYLLEANPNPNLAKDDEFAQAARAAGIPYEQLLTRLL